MVSKKNASHTGCNCPHCYAEQSANPEMAFCVGFITGLNAESAGEALASLCERHRDLIRNFVVAMAKANATAAHESSDNAPQAAAILN